MLGPCSRPKPGEILPAAVEQTVKPLSSDLDQEDLRPPVPATYPRDEIRRRESAEQRPRVPDRIPDGDEFDRDPAGRSCGQRGSKHRLFRDDVANVAGNDEAASGGRRGEISARHVVAHDPVASFHANRSARRFEDQIERRHDTVAMEQPSPGDHVARVHDESVDGMHDGGGRHQRPSLNREYSSAATRAWARASG